jgi:hypothetical protein
MKKVIFFSAFLMISLLSDAQNSTRLFDGKLKKEEVPTVVIKQLEKDFPNEVATKYFGIPADLVGETIFWNTERAADNKDFDFYTISLSGKGALFTATYDKDGKLLNKIEELKNITLPREIDRAIGTEFPGYAVQNDKMLLTAYKDNHEVVHYKVRLNKGKENFWVVYDADANLVRGKSHEMHEKL